MNICRTATLLAVVFQAVLGSHNGKNEQWRTEEQKLKDESVALWVAEQRKTTFGRALSTEKGKLERLSTKLSFERGKADGLFIRESEIKASLKSGESPSDNEALGRECAVIEAEREKLRRCVIPQLEREIKLKKLKIQTLEMELRLAEDQLRRTRIAERRWPFADRNFN